MVMAGRHIRHDWQQFVAWDQKSVRTLCNKTSTWNATGIPGVSEQPEVVAAGSKMVFGWCSACAVSAHKTAWDAMEGAPMHPYVRPMYEDVINITAPIYNAWLARQQSWRRV